ncbi:MAG: cysteine synthase family protein [Actinomycetaceae bacterium]|nr:cysteine synthase family protein [Actinomycetaceae bacterium]
MAIYRSMHELIGNTPLVELRHIHSFPHVRVWAKMELMNPGGSVKDRTGMSMIRDAEFNGLLHTGSHIVEATAGNTGIGIAFAALERGYKVTFVVPEKFSEEKQVLMRALGADVINTSAEGGISEAVARAEEILRTNTQAVSLQQFDNPANPRVHEETTGKEIIDDLASIGIDAHSIDVFVAGAGSGGTYSGVARKLKSVHPRVHCVLADPVGSTMGGGEHAPYKTEGIGNNFIARTMDMSLVDEIIKVNDEQAFGTSRMLAQKEGIIAGSSSGAAVWASIEIARKIHQGEYFSGAPWMPLEERNQLNIVTLLPDRGDRYFSAHLYE